MTTSVLKLFTHILATGTILLSTFNSYAQHDMKDDKTKGKKGSAKVTFTVDTTTIERIMGIKGKSNNGEYKVTVPQNDLTIMVDSFKIIPAMGLGTWVAF